MRGRRGTWGQEIEGGRVGTWGKEVRVNPLNIPVISSTFKELVDSLHKSCFDASKMDPKLLTTAQSKSSAAEFKILYGWPRHAPNISLDFCIEDEGFHEKKPLTQGGKTMTNYMDKETAKALAESIAKWWDILVGGGEDLGGKNCALCKKFAPENGCIGCPIKQKTGRGGCIGSPYGKWIEHTGSHRSTARKVQCPECVDLARKMHAFLVDLKPERHEILYTLEEALRLGWRVKKTTWRPQGTTELRHTFSNTNFRAGRALQFWDKSGEYSNVFEPVKTKYWETKDWVVHHDGFYDKPRAFSMNGYLNSNWIELKTSEVDLNTTPVNNLSTYVNALVDQRIEELASTPGMVLSIPATKKDYNPRKPSIESMIGKVVHRTKPTKRNDHSYTDTRLILTGICKDSLHFKYLPDSSLEGTHTLSRDRWDDGCWVEDSCKCVCGCDKKKCK